MRKAVEQVRRLGDNDDTREKRMELCYPDFQVSWVICDEGHIIKNPMSLSHMLVDSIRRDFTLVVTATPLLNSIRDILGFLNVIWRPEWPFGYTTADEVAAEHFYTQETWSRIAADEKDQSYRVTPERILSGGLMKIADMGPVELQSQARFTKAIKDGTYPLYILNPQLFAAFAKTTQYSMDTSLQAIKPIMELVSVPRDMLTPLAMPDGSETMPGDDIPPMTLQTRELKHRVGNVAEIAANISGLARDVITATPSKTQATRRGSRSSPGARRSTLARCAPLP